MTNITDADRASAHKYLQDCNDSGQLAVVMATKADRLYQAFAAHRIAAVAKREKEIVAILKDESRAYRAIGSKHAHEALESVLRIIQTPSEGA